MIGKGNLGPMARFWQSYLMTNANAVLDEGSVVIKCCDTINNWKNPVEGSYSLFCLSSGIVACHEVKEDMLNAENIGPRRLEIFITERIETNHTVLYANINKLLRNKRKIEGPKQQDFDHS